MRTAILLIGFALAGQMNTSLIKGMVFTADGAIFTGAKITVVRTDVDARQQKKSKREAFSDRNGEFAFRLEPGPAKFHLTVEAKGFKTEEKDVEISGVERADISLVLKQ